VLLSKLAIYHWQQQWGDSHDGDTDDNEANNDDNDEADDPECKHWEWRAAMHLQHYLITMLTFLGGGQCLQIYAELFNEDLFHDEDDLLVIHVSVEKVPWQNIDHLPLLPQLWNALEYFQQYIWPTHTHTCHAHMHINTLSQTAQWTASIKDVFQDGGPSLL
jgi:hypothetical protein